MRKTPRSLELEIEGAKFVFKRSDLIEVGGYFSRRPKAIGDFVDLRNKRNQEGNPLTEAESAEHIKEITDTCGDWFSFRSDFVLSKIQSIEGLTYEDGEPLPVDAETLRADLPMDVLNQIYTFYEGVMVSSLPSRVDEKKTGTDE